MFIFFTYLDPHGIKLFAAAESETGYVFSAFVDTSHPPGNPTHGPITKTIIHLLEMGDVTGQGYILWTDNYFRLATTLVSH